MVTSAIPPANIRSGKLYHAEGVNSFRIVGGYKAQTSSKRREKYSKGIEKA